MPGERKSECVRRILDVNDAAVRGSRGWARSVEREWAKGEERGLGGETNGLRKSCAELVNRVGGEAAESMHSVEDSHRSIVGAAWIEMQADRMDRHWRLTSVCGHSGPILILIVVSFPLEQPFHVLAGFGERALAGPYQPRCAWEARRIRGIVVATHEEPTAPVVGAYLENPDLTRVSHGPHSLDVRR